MSSTKLTDLSLPSSHISVRQHSLPSWRRECDRWHVNPVALPYCTATTWQGGTDSRRRRRLHQISMTRGKKCSLARSLALVPMVYIPQSPVRRMAALPSPQREHAYLFNDMPLVPQNILTDELSPSFILYFRTHELVRVRA